MKHYSGMGPRARLLIALIFLAFTLPIVAQDELPDAPHKFMDKQNVALFAVAGVGRGLDVYTTHRNLATGGHEDMLPTALVKNPAAFSAYHAGGMALQIYTAHWLHKRGHHRLERALNYGNAAFYIGIAAANYARR